MRFFPLERAINLQDGYRRAFKIDHHQLLLLQQDGEIHVLESSCPHRAHSLAAAVIAGGEIECPLHRYRFSLASGELIYASEQPCRALRVYPLVFRGSEVGVMLEEGP